MTPMPANSDRDFEDPSRSPGALRHTRLTLVRDTAPATSPNELAVFKSPATLVLSAAPPLDASAVEGTVAVAAVVPPEGESYTAGSDALLSGAPLTRIHHRQSSTVPRVRATDLVSELREISGQVNRMMSQVDRAIHRLGEHAGPLRR